MGVCSGPTQPARHDNPVDNGSWGYAALWVSDAAVVKRIRGVSSIGTDMCCSAYSFICGVQEYVEYTA